MLVFWYLTRRFVSYWCVINVLLAFIFNFIEFFEKLARVKNTSTGTILHFLSLNIVPSFFDLVPMSLWLSMCLLLKEVSAQHEWDWLQLLTYIPKRLLMFAAIMGVCFGLVTFVVKESYVVQLTQQSERFRQEKFKQGRMDTLVGAWFQLDNHTFCYCGVLDLSSNQGSDWILIKVTPQMTIQTIVMAPTFLIDTTNATVTLPVGQQIKEQSSSELKDFTFRLPSFFSQVHITQDVPTLGKMMKKILLLKRHLPVGVYNKILQDFFLRVVFYLQILIYPLLTLCLFLLIPQGIRRWLLVLSPYPVVMGLGTVMDWFVRSGMAAWVVLIPYIIFMFFIGWFWSKKTG